MCITFLYVNNDAAASSYKLIIASNRDEFYDRPTKPAARWGDNSQCISGLDEHADREGGTWLGISEKGKVGILLNIASPHGPSQDKMNRGFLVADYLSSNKSADEYTSEINPLANQYNGFSLVLLELRSFNWHITYMSNEEPEAATVLPVDGATVYGWSNSQMSRSWVKVEQGKQRFLDVINSYNKTSQRDELLPNLMSLLKDRTPRLPDAHLEALREFKGDSVVDALSRIFVDMDHVKYGTRTNTIILVDQAGNGEFVERTRESTAGETEPVWQTRSIGFCMTPSPIVLKPGSL